MVTRLIALMFVLAFGGCEDRGACEGIPVSDGLTQEQCVEIKYRMSGADPTSARWLAKKALEKKAHTDKQEDKGI